MSTTKSNFLRMASTSLPGANTPEVLIVLAQAAANVASGSKLADILDRVSVDLSTAGYAKNGGTIQTLAPSTPHNVDFTAMGSESVVAGDLSLGTWNLILFRNLGNQDVIVTPGASNPLQTPLTGTTPGITVYANSWHVWSCPAGKVVDSTRKVLTLDPGGSAAKLAIIYAGA